MKGSVSAPYTPQGKGLLPEEGSDLNKASGIIRISGKSPSGACRSKIVIELWRNYFAGGESRKGTSRNVGAQVGQLCRKSFIKSLLCPQARYMFCSPILTNFNDPERRKLTNLSSVRRHLLNFSETNPAPKAPCKF